MAKKTLRQKLKNTALGVGGAVAIALIPYSAVAGDCEFALVENQEKYNKALNIAAVQQKRYAFLGYGDVKIKDRENNTFIYELKNGEKPWENAFKITKYSPEGASISVTDGINDNLYGIRMNSTLDRAQTNRAHNNLPLAIQDVCGNEGIQRAIKNLFEEGVDLIIRSYPDTTSKDLKFIGKYFPTLLE